MTKIFINHHQVFIIFYHALCNIDSYSPIETLSPVTIMLLQKKGKKRKKEQYIVTSLGEVLNPKENEPYKTIGPVSCVCLTYHAAIHTTWGWTSILWLSLKHWPSHIRIWDPWFFVMNKEVCVGARILNDVSSSLVLFAFGWFRNHDI